MGFHCDYCSKSILDSIQIILPCCGFSVCIIHLIPECEFQKCHLCAEPINVESCLKMPKNKITIKENELRLKADDINKKINEFKIIKANPKFYIEENFSQVLNKIDLRCEELKFKLNSEIDEYSSKLREKVIISRENCLLNFNKKIKNIDFKEYEINTKENSINNRLISIDFELLKLQDKFLNIESLHEILTKGKHFDLLINDDDIQVSKIFGELITAKDIEINKIIPIRDESNEFGDTLTDLPSKENNGLLKWNRTFSIMRENLNCKKLVINDETPSLKLENSFIVQKTLKAHSDFIICLFLGQNDEIITGSKDGKIKIWNKKTGECFKIYNYNKPVFCVNQLENGDIISGYEDGNIKIWPRSSNENILSLRMKNFLNLKSNDGNSSSNDELSITVSDSKRTLFGHNRPVRHLLILKPNEILSSSDDCSIKLWDKNKSKCKKTLDEHTGQTTYVEYSAVNDIIITSSNNCKIKIWNRDGVCLKTLEDHTDSILKFKILDNFKMVSISGSKVIKIWDILTGECCKTINGFNDIIREIMVLNSLEILIVVDKNLQLWNLETYELIHNFYGHSELIWDVIALKNNKIITSSKDKTLKIWDRRNGECLLTLNGHNAEVNKVIVTNDNEIISVSNDGVLKIWA